LNCTTVRAAMSMNTLITLEVKFYSAVLCEGLCLGFEFFKKVLTTTLVQAIAKVTTDCEHVVICVCRMVPFRMTLNDYGSFTGFSQKQSIIETKSKKQAKLFLL